MITNENLTEPILRAGSAIPYLRAGMKITYRWEDWIISSVGERDGELVACCLLGDGTVWGWPIWSYMIVGLPHLRDNARLAADFKP